MHFWKLYWNKNWVKVLFSHFFALKRFFFLLVRDWDGKCQAGELEISDIPNKNCCRMFCTKPMLPAIYENPICIRKSDMYTGNLNSARDVCFHPCFRRAPNRALGCIQETVISGKAFHGNRLMSVEAGP